MVVTLLIGIVSTPILLGFLGDERVGAFRVASDWAGYLVLFELGLSGALRARFAKAVAHSEQATSSAFAAGVVMYRRVTAWTLLAACVFAGVIPWVIPVESSLRTELVLAWLLLAATSFGLLLGPIRPLQESVQQGFIVNHLLLVQSVAITAAGVFLAWAGWGIISQAAGVLVGSLILGAVSYWWLKENHPSLCYQLIRPSLNADEQKQLSKLSLPTFASRISGQIGVMSDNILIGFMLGPAAVVPFFLTQRISSVAQGLLQSFSGSSWAGLADLYHRQQTELLQDRVVELTRLITIVAVIILAPILVFNRHFVALWVGEERFGGELLTLFAVINALLLSILSLWGLLFAGTEKISVVARLSVASAIVNVVVSIPATYFLGLVGPLIGTLTALVLVQGTRYPTLLKAHFGISRRAIFAALATPWLVSAPVIVAAWWVVHRYPSLQPGSWLELTAAVGLMSISLSILQWRLCFDDQCRQLWKRRILNFSVVST
jgi:O-antigen/teichoic acid export membrane protein